VFVFNLEYRPDSTECFVCFSVCLLAVDWFSAFRLHYEKGDIQYVELCCLNVFFLLSHQCEAAAFTVFYV
jgi:hypothetical protein